MNHRINSQCVLRPQWTAIVLLMTLLVQGIRRLGGAVCLQAVAEWTRRFAGYSHPCRIF